MNDPVLTDSDLISPMWLKLVEYLKAEVLMLDRANRNDMDERATAKIRGKIAALNQVLGLAKTLPKIESTKPRY